MKNDTYDYSCAKKVNNMFMVCKRSFILNLIEPNRCGHSERGTLQPRAPSVAAASSAFLRSSCTANKKSGVMSHHGSSTSTTGSSPTETPIMAIGLPVHTGQLGKVVEFHHHPYVRFRDSKVARSFPAVTYIANKKSGFMSHRGTSGSATGASSSVAARICAAC
jgi:hypothetical protein